MNDSYEWIVLDTNVLISWLLAVDSVSGRAAANVVKSKRLIASSETMTELAEVLGRSKFDHYATIDQRIQFLRLVGHAARPIPIIQRVHACRNPRDDKFLELALNGQADLIVTGDRDLLALHPFHGITIQSPADYFASL